MAAPPAGSPPYVDRLFSDPAYPESQCWRFAEVSTTNTGALRISYRIVHPEGAAYQGAKLKVRYQEFVTVAGSSGKPIENSKGEVDAEQTLMEPWVFFAEFEVSGAQTRVQVEVLKDGSKVIFPANEPDVIEFGNPVTKTAKTSARVTRHPPRLVLDINRAGRRVYRGTAATEREKVIAILKWVERGLLNGLRDVWLGPNTGRGVHVEQQTVGDPPKRLEGEALNEERWARRITAMMALAPYMGPGTAYSMSEPDFFRAMDARRIDSNQPAEDPPALPAPRSASLPPYMDDTFYPVVVMCQQLCTVGYLSRGVHLYSYLGNRGLNAWGNKPLHVFKDDSKYQGKWHEGEGFLQAKTALSGAPPPAQPGSIYEFARERTTEEEKKRNLDGDHVGLVIRTYATDVGWAIQTLDTGGLNAPNRATGASPPFRPTFDDPWVQKVTGPLGVPKVFDGLGTPGPQFKPSAGRIAGLDLWWPLAFARLVVTKRDEKDAKKAVAYRTPLLRMHPISGNWAIDFPAAALAWSLRNLPFSAEFEAAWYIGTPREDRLLDSLMRSERLATVPAIVEGAASTAKAKVPCAKKHYPSVLLVSRFFSESSSSKVSTVGWQGLTRDDGSPWGAASGRLADSIAPADFTEPSSPRPHLAGSDPACGLACTSCPYGYPDPGKSS